METSCSRYIPNVLVGSGGSTELTCEPVYSCNSTLPDLEIVSWWRFDNETEYNNTFNDLNKTDISSQHRAKLNITGEFNETLNFDFNAKKRHLVGYYFPTFELTNEARLWNGQKFTVYSKSMRVTCTMGAYCSLAQRGR